MNPIIPQIATAIRREFLKQAIRQAYSRQTARETLLQYKSEADGRWITIGGKETGRKGTHVKIDGDGNILAGPKAITGQNLDDFSLKKPKSKPTAPKQTQKPLVNKHFAPIPRAEMPQVLTKDKPELFDWLADKGVGVSDTTISASRLQPSQDERNTETLKKMVDQLRESGPENLPAILVAKDGTIIDGHHRWHAQMEVDPNGKINVKQIDLSGQAAIDTIKQFPKSFTRYADATTNADLGAGVQTLPDGRKVGITMLPVDQIAFDPRRFQYKVEGITEGVSENLKDVKVFRPEFAGQLLGWHDPADGKVYVVNGHHRHELAKRTGYKAPMPIYLIDAKDSNEARALGALANMAAGHGTALDAAKFMRESAVGIDDLKSRGVSIKGKVAEDGLVLSKLSDNLFNRVASERERQGVALAIGRHIENHDVQNQIYNEVQKAEKRGRRLTDSAIEEMAKEAATAPTRSESIGGLFGDLEETRALLAERGILKAGLRKQLTGDAKAFIEVSRRGRAEALASAGNVLDVEKNKQLAQESEELLFAFSKLANTKGEVSDAINRAAEQLADRPKDVKRITKELYREITPALQAAYGGTTGSADGATADDNGVRADYSRASWANAFSAALGRGIAERRRLRYGKWDESKHPRASDGRFGTKAGEHGGSSLIERTTNKHGALIFKVKQGGKSVGHIAGEEETGYGESGNTFKETGISKGSFFRLWNTEIDEGHRGQGLYQQAIQEIANQYDNGIVCEKFQASTALQKALRKIDGHRETEDAIVIPPKSKDNESSASPRAKQVRSPEFKKWFGDSKVVDENGEPLVVYHGTSKTVGNSLVSSHDSRAGVYFTPSANVASGYAAGLDPTGAKVFPVYLSIQRPFVTTDSTFTSTASASAISDLAAKGFDGIVLTDDGKAPIGNALEIIPFKPTQIKSATGNRGTFDPGDSRLNFAAGRFDESKHPRDASGEFAKGSSGAEKQLDLTGWDKPIKQAPSLPGQKPLFDEIELRFAIKDAFDRRVAKDKAAGQKRMFKAGATKPWRAQEHPRSSNGEFASHGPETIPGGMKPEPPYRERAHRDTPKPEPVHSGPPEVWSSDRAKADKAAGRYSRRELVEAIRVRYAKKYKSETSSMPALSKQPNSESTKPTSSSANKTGCGANAPGGGGFQPGNTCAGGGGQSSDAASSGKSGQEPGPQRPGQQAAPNAGQPSGGQASQQAKHSTGGNVFSRMTPELKQKINAIEQQYRPLNGNGIDTFERYRDKQGNWSPKRRNLHDKIIGEMMAGAVKPPPGQRPIFTFMGGGPASGKGTLLHGGLVELPQGHVKIDPDEVKFKLPEFAAMAEARNADGAAYAHEESSEVGKRAVATLLGSGYHGVLDGTGDSSYEKLAQKVAQARAAGHRIDAHYVTVDTEEAVRRSNKRGQRTGRVVPESVIRETHQSVSRVVPEAIKNGLFDNFSLWDTEVPEGQKPHLVASARGNQLQIHHPEKWQKFLDKGK